MRIMQKIKRFLIHRTDTDVDAAAQASAVVAAYTSALKDNDLEHPGSMSMYVVADSDGDGDVGDAQVLYCVSDRYASWYVLATGTDATVIALYAYVYDGWADEEAFAYSEDVADTFDAALKADAIPTEKTARDTWIVKALSGVDEQETPVVKRAYTPIAKSDVQRYTLGVAYPHSEVDSHGDFTDEVELEQAAWNFMRSVVAKGEGGVGTDHAEGTDDAAQVVESYIYRGPTYVAKVDDGDDVEIKTGDWMVGAVWTEDAWERVEKGELTGWSIQGLAYMDEDAEPPAEA